MIWGGGDGLEVWMRALSLSDFILLMRSEGWTHKDQGSLNLTTEGLMTFDSRKGLRELRVKLCESVQNWQIWLKAKLSDQGRRRMQLVFSELPPSYHQSDEPRPRLAGYCEHIPLSTIAWHSYQYRDLGKWGTKVQSQVLGLISQFVHSSLDGNQRSDCGPI